MTQSHQHDERLSFASTIPSSWYFDRSLLERETASIFGRTWQLVGREEQVPEAGCYFTTTVADEPLIVIRGKDGEIRALSNVCRHRAGPVASGEGKRPVLQCGYHGWTYGIDGSLLVTPEFEGVECFEKTEVRLPSFRVETWQGLLFVNLDRAAVPLSAVMKDVETLLAGDDLSQYRFARRKEWTLDCNWKVYVDNYLEGYHIPIVHPALFRELDYENYRTETLGQVSIQHSPIRRAERLRKGDGDSEAKFFWAFPNLMFNVYPDNFSTNLILPLGVDRTLTVFDWYFRDPALPEVKAMIEQTVEFSDEIQLEDIAICEAVQRGLKSSTYSAGRYSVKRENGVHHFHGLLAEHLGAR
ncbi:MAG TPA: SRPBCC family protein [Thermoanaerobaculia bacterium]|nr:SRPBCC family protein [Thermoanaerobaculia bacterium]